MITKGRKRNHRDYQKQTLVIVEGETEEAYFAALRQYFECT